MDSIISSGKRRITAKSIVSPYYGELSMVNNSGSIHVYTMVSSH